MQPSISAPFFDGKGESFAKYAQQALLWCEVTNLQLAKRASTLISHVDAVAREVWLAAGGDVFSGQWDSKENAGQLSKYIAPGAADYAFQQVVRFS